MRPHLTRIAALAAAATTIAVAALPVAPAHAQDVQHAFIFVIDGVRASEGFDDPIHLNVAAMYEQLAPVGSLLTYAEVRDQPETIPSHNTMMSGTYADIANLSTYEGRENFGQREPTLFEAYRMQSGEPADSCWVVGNTPLIHDAAHSIFPGYGEDYAASRALDYTGTMHNQFAWDHIEEKMGEAEIRLMLVNLHETDRLAHAGSWIGYVDKTRESSEYIVDFWDALQADPVYQDSTLLIVATDHGRHEEGVLSGWLDHGCSCAGCRQAFILAVGPGIRPGFESDEAVSTLDIAPTVAHLMGVQFPYHRGRILTEILEDGAAVDQGPGGMGEYRPEVVAAGGLLVRVAELQDGEETDADGAHRVQVELSEDGGDSWEAWDSGEDDVLQYAPAAWTDGEVALAAWLEIEVKGEEWRTRVMRNGAESADWEEVLYEDMEGSSTPVGNLALRTVGDDLVLSEMNARQETIRMWTSDDRGLSWAEEVDYTVERYFPRDVSHVQAGDNLVVAYSAHAEGPPHLTDVNDNTEIYWMVSDDGGDSWSEENRLTDDDAPSVTPVLAVTPDAVLHLVWADAEDGVFQIFQAESTDDGETFTDPAQLTDDGLGAWEPAAVADGERLYVAWSRFDDVDEASLHVAALEDGALVEERILTDGGMVARTPHIAPLGDCSSLVTWSQSDLAAGWELAQAVVVTAGHPATGAGGTVEPDEVEAGLVGVELTLSGQIEVGDDDRGLDAIEVVLPDGLAADGGAELDVDGDLVESSASVDGGLLRVELAELVDTDGATLTLRFTVEVAAEPFEARSLTATLHRGLETCSTEVEGELTVAAVEASGDDDTTDEPDDDDDSAGDGTDCDCDADGRTAPAPLALLVVLGLLMLRRRLA